VVVGAVVASLLLAEREQLIYVAVAVTHGCVVAPAMPAETVAAGIGVELRLTETDCALAH
jgi:hypothetical protein